MKKIIHALLTALVFALPNALSAQYSNASFNGPWILEVQDYDYIIYDGNGTINALGIARDSLFPVGTYSVQSNGAFTGSLTLTNGVTSITGNLTSDSTATFMLNGQGPYSEVRANGPGNSPDTLTGTIYDSTSHITRNVTMTVSSNGVLSYAGGDLSGISGQIFGGPEVVVAALLTSTDSSCLWKIIQLSGRSTNRIFGTALFGNTDTGSCNSHGSFLFKGESVVSTAIDNIPADLNFSVYPNPSIAGFTITMNAGQLPITGEKPGAVIEVFDMSGKLVFKSEIRSPNSEIAFESAPGVYLLRISNERNSVVRKLVKL